jgi:hypothetical protein
MKTTIYHRTIHFIKECNGKTFAVVVRPANLKDMEYLKSDIAINGSEKSYKSIKQFAYEQGIRGIRTGNMYWRLDLPKIN